MSAPDVKTGDAKNHHYCHASSSRQLHFYLGGVIKGNFIDQSSFNSIVFHARLLRDFKN